MTDEERTRAHRGYMMYDWAKSGFETSVVVAVLPAWFAYLFIAANGQEMSFLGMTQTADGIFALVTASAALLVAIISRIGGHRRPYSNQTAHASMGDHHRVSRHGFAWPCLVPPDRNPVGVVGDHVPHREHRDQRR